MNDNITVRKYNPWWCSHLPVLTRVMELSHGPVLELGVGIYSTPLLHTFCEEKKRPLFSYENDQQWFEAHQHFVKGFHSITLVKNWDEVPIEKTHWGVVLIDHPSKRRSIDAIRVSKCADFVLLHDSNGRFEEQYHYSRVYPFFKYRYDYNTLYPHTTIVSNFIPVHTLWTT